MRAVDADESQTVFYRLKQPSKEFAINSFTGEVAVVYGLDRETVDSYRNDNGPLFERGHYDVLVAKGTLPGQNIVTLSTYDPDQPVAGNGPMEAAWINDYGDDMYLQCTYTCIRVLDRGLAHAGMNTVYYRIKETLFEYRGMSQTIQHMFSITPTSGVVQLQQTASDFTGGVFHLLVESMDDPTAAKAQKDHCIVNVHIHEESDIVRLELPIPPAAMDYEKIDNIKGTLANATGLKVIMKDLRYHHEEGELFYDVTDLRLVFVNRSSSEIIPAERAIAIADRHRSTMSSQMPSMTRAQVFSTSVKHSSIPPLAYVLGVFALSLTMVFIIFAFMICHYRNKFKFEKKIHEGDVIITNSLNTPPLRPMKIPSMIPFQMISAFFPAIHDSYAVQERKMVVGADDNHQSH
uniref:Cadherin domain-containing protein n=1 Tax=Angiostrongylus cantonensis TaxID=6313 RepID=A0A158PB86_ANGCA